MGELILIDGKNLDEPLTRSLFYGEGVFESFRWKERCPVFINEHLKRLKNGAETLKIPFPDKDYILNQIETAVSQSYSDDLYIKIAIISKGDRIFFKTPDESSLLVLTREYIEADEDVSVCVASQKKNQDSVLISLKTFNYLDNIIARRDAIDRGFDDAIFLNSNDDITEATSSNIFWVRGKDLFTPGTECGLLPGITRMEVINIAQGMGYKINARKFDLSYLLNSDYAFLTNSLRGMAYINNINVQKMPPRTDSFIRMKEMLDKSLGWIQ